MFKTLRTALFGMGAFLLAGGLLTVPAQASDYPSKPIQLVSPYGAGGDSDLTARVWAEFAKKKLGQPVVVVNKTGGGGLTGSLFAAKAKPDGYTLFLAQAGPNIIIPLTAKGANYSFDSFDYIVVENEHESLVLEKNLINQHSPFFNADFKDDKSYPFIALTKGDVFPAIKYTREKHRADTRYFGPYTDSRAARAMVDIARKVVPLCAASCADWRQLKRRLEKDDLAVMRRGARPCFDAHVGLGPGACCGQITPEEYAGNVRKIERFLSGNHREFLEELDAEMREAAAELDFERAGRIKARIDTINALSDKQHAVSTRNLNADVSAFPRG